jgi:selenoprotein W-related protein
MPEVRIVYCKPCGYLTKAQAVATALQRELGLTAMLEPGKGGVFQTRVDGVAVLARRKGYFPTPSDVVKAVRKTLRGADAAPTPRPRTP